MDKLTQEQREMIETILHEAGQHGLAFVGDDFGGLADDDESYIPEIDFETAYDWLRSKLIEVLKSK